MRGRPRALQPETSDHTTAVWTWHSKVDVAAETSGRELGVSSGRAGEQDAVHQPETCRAAVAFTGERRETHWFLHGQHFSDSTAGRGGPPGHPPQALTVPLRVEDSAAPGQPLGA